MNIPRSDTFSAPTRPLDSLAWLYQTPQAELDALGTVWQHYQAGVLTLNEAMSTMEGKQLWQLLALHWFKACDLACDVSAPRSF